MRSCERENPKATKLDVGDLPHRGLLLDLLFALFHLQLPPVGRMVRTFASASCGGTATGRLTEKAQRLLAQPRREANFDPPPTDAYSAELPRYAVRANSAIGAGATVARSSVCTWRSTVGFDVPPPSSPDRPTIFRHPVIRERCVVRQG
jgi:hypothetical protein